MMLQGTQPTAHNYSFLITNLLHYHPLILNGHVIHYDLMYTFLYKDTHYWRVHLAYFANNTEFNQSLCRVKIVASTNDVYRVQNYNNCRVSINFAGYIQRKNVASNWTSCTRYTYVELSLVVRVCSVFILN